VRDRAIWLSLRGNGAMLATQGCDLCAKTEKNARFSSKTRSFSAKNGSILVFFSPAGNAQLLRVLVRSGVGARSPLMKNMLYKQCDKEGRPRGLDGFFT
jgi:hypothetical protein